MCGRSGGGTRFDNARVPRLRDARNFFPRTGYVPRLPGSIFCLRNQAFLTHTLTLGPPCLY